MDGISLGPLLEGKQDKRSRAMGFWAFPEAGIRTPSAEWMSELLEAQKLGNMVGDSSRLRLDAGEISRLYPLDTLPGHSAWLDWPWKLHRIAQENGTVYWELYNLEGDSMESVNLVKEYPEMVASMQSSLEHWQVSVVGSMNGADY